MADNKKYVMSDAVKQAQAALQQQQAQKPGAYQSQWQQSLNDTVANIQNRKPFKYNLNEDALYQQYADRYVQQGQQAMMDTMGQAATLTGGYGNSYAQQVGQQTYQGYLQGLNDMIPDFYSMALQRYQAEGDSLMDQYGLLADRDNTDYGRYMDCLNNYYKQLDIMQNQYNSQLNFDYGQYRDAMADAQWQAEFDENMRRYNQEWAAANAPAGGSGSSGGGGGSGGGNSTYAGTPEAETGWDKNAVLAALESDFPNKVVTSAEDWKFAVNMVGGNEAALINAGFVKRFAPGASGGGGNNRVSNRDNRFN